MPGGHQRTASGGSLASSLASSLGVPVEKRAPQEEFERAPVETADEELPRTLSKSGSFRCLRERKEDAAYRRAEFRHSEAAVDFLQADRAENAAKKKRLQPPQQLAGEAAEVPQYLLRQLRDADYEVYRDEVKAAKEREAKGSPPCAAPPQLTSPVLHTASIRNLRGLRRGSADSWALSRRAAPSALSASALDRDESWGSLCSTSPTHTASGCASPMSAGSAQPRAHGADVPGYLLRQLGDAEQAEHKAAQESALKAATHKLRQKRAWGDMLENLQHAEVSADSSVVLRFNYGSAHCAQPGGAAVAPHCAHAQLSSDCGSDGCGDRAPAPPPAAAADGLPQIVIETDLSTRDLLSIQQYCASGKADLSERGPAHGATPTPPSQATVPMSQPLLCMQCPDVVGDDEAWPVLPAAAATNDVPSPAARSRSASDASSLAVDVLLMSLEEDAVVCDAPDVVRAPLRLSNEAAPAAAKAAACSVASRKRARSLARPGTSEVLPRRPRAVLTRSETWGAESSARLHNEASAPHRRSSRKDSRPRGKAPRRAASATKELATRVRTYAARAQSYGSAPVPAKDPVPAAPRGSGSQRTLSRQSSKAQRSAAGSCSLRGSVQDTPWTRVASPPSEPVWSPVERQLLPPVVGLGCRESYRRQPSRKPEHHRRELLADGDG